MQVSAPSCLQSSLREKYRVGEKIERGGGSVRYSARSRSPKGIMEKWAMRWRLKGEREVALHTRSGRQSQAW